MSSQFQNLLYRSKRDGKNKVTMFTEEIAAVPCEQIELLSEGQSFFRYVSNETLTDKYFKAASNSLDDEHIYIMLTDSGSPASELISVFTKRQFGACLF